MQTLKNLNSLKSNLLSTQILLCNGNSKKYKIIKINALKNWQFQNLIVSLCQQKELYTIH